MSAGQITLNFGAATICIRNKNMKLDLQLIDTFYFPG
jgi:hypothetical protein